MKHPALFSALLCIATVAYSSTGHAPQKPNYNSVSSEAATNIQVSGDVSGLWTNNNVYVIMGHARVPQGQTLDIQKGTVVKFNGSFSLTVDGTLNALGTSTEKIVFTSNKTSPAPSDWESILINGGTSTIDYCCVEYGKQCIIVNSGNSVISNSTIRHIGLSGLVLISSDAQVVHNDIYDFVNYLGTGVHIRYGEPLIACNNIGDGDRRAIGVNGGGTIEGNVIYNMEHSGIDCGAYSTAHIRHNVVRGCWSGIWIGETVDTPVNPVITNNTLYSNQAGILIPDFYGNATIVNNVITGNEYGIRQHGAQMGHNNTPEEVSHNLVWNNAMGNFKDVNVPNIGQANGSNANGDSCDAYFNISIDPEFINNTPPDFSSASPCLNAGHTQYGNNLGAESGKSCLQQTTRIPETNDPSSLRVFPNPCGSDVFLANQGKQIARVRVYDLSGRLVGEPHFRTVKEGVIVSLPVLPSGLYFLNVESNDAPSQMVRIVKE